MKVKSIKTRDIIKLYEKQQLAFNKAVESDVTFKIDQEFNTLYGILKVLNLAGYTIEDLK